MYSCTTLDGTRNFRSPELNTLLFPLSFSPSWFSDLLQHRCLWCSAAYVLMMNRECGCSRACECAGPGVCVWMTFICFSCFPPSTNLFSRLLSQKLWEVCSGWLPLLCVLSLPRWERGAVLLWKPWVPLCTWLRSTPSVPCKPGEYVKGYLLLLCLAAQHAHWNCHAWLIPRSRDAAKGT